MVKSRPDDVHWWLRTGSPIKEIEFLIYLTRVIKIHLAIGSGSVTCSRLIRFISALWLQRKIRGDHKATPDSNTLDAGLESEASAELYGSRAACSKALADAFC